jgi:hypothetical protein
MRIKIPSEVAYPQNKQSRPDRDAYPHFETATISKQIELEMWGCAKSLYLFVFARNLFYLVHFHTSGDSQSHWKLPNGFGFI